ncbi:MAG: glutaredoxin 3 [Gammaproteobacteria bacterium]|nr:glutaredoxin 3 [Gammaproteobacteria bacterium]
MSDDAKPLVVMYTTMLCPYCTRAKFLFEKKGVEVTEIRVDSDPKKRDEMLVRSEGQRTVPQIFIGEVHVGDSEALYELEREGKLDALLNQSSK